MFVDFLDESSLGIFASTTWVLLNQPLDTVKAKMQVFPNVYSSMISCFKKTVKQQGYRGLWAGSVPGITSKFIHNNIMSLTYNPFRNAVAALTGSHVSDLHIAEKAAVHIAMSFCSAFAVTPCELLKIRMQNNFYMLDTVSDGMRSAFTREMIKNVSKINVYKGYNRGFWATFAYKSISRFDVERESPNELRNQVFNEIAGISSFLLSYPFDVIKSRMQMTVKGGYRDVLKEIGSFRAFYYGLWPSILIGLPVAILILPLVPIVYYLNNEYPKPPTIYSWRFSYWSTSDPPTMDPPMDKHSSPPPVVPAPSVADEHLFESCDFVSGYFAGIVSTCVGHPVDTVKVVQQVTNSSTGKAIRDIFNENKVSGYFRGMMFPALLAGFTNSLFFGGFGNTMRFIQSYRDGKENQAENLDVRHCCDLENLHDKWHQDMFVSGCVGGLFYSVVNIPTEVIKTTLQATSASTSEPGNGRSQGKAGPSKANNSVKLFTELYKTYGIRSLYRGGMILLIRDVPSMGIFVLSYEHLHCYLRKYASSETELEPVPMFVPLLAGGVAGVLSRALFLPFDVMKSKIIADSLTQPKYKGAWDCAKKTYKEGGTRRFFRGFWLVCIRSFPMNAIAFVVYESILKSCNYLETTIATSSSPRTIS